jgi:hypothetical protein
MGEPTAAASLPVGGFVTSRLRDCGGIAREATDGRTEAGLAAATAQPERSLTRSAKQRNPCGGVMILFQ